MVPLTLVQLFTHTAVTRGGAVQGLLLARTLQERGHRVISWFHAPFHSEIQQLAASLRPAGVSDLDIRWINMKHPLSYYRFRRWLRREQPDILHTHRSLALLFGYFTAAGIPHTALVANRGAITDLPNPLVRTVLRSRRLDHMIAVAQAVKQHLVEELHLDPGKISVVYGSFDARRFTPQRDGSRIRKEFDLAAGNRLVVCVAAIEPRKGLEFLISAASPVIAQIPAARFLVVGNIDDPAYYRRLQTRVSACGLDQHLVFTGHRSDIPEILAAADVAISTSLQEGLAGALREALAMEKPVVCTAVGGNPELIRDGESGWVASPGNAQALANALIEALEQPAEAQRRARNGRQTMLRCCTNEVRCDRIEQIYHEVHQKRRSASKPDHSTQLPL
jgi:glycosyltransferase involved in cell wall biosynthesis